MRSLLRALGFMGAVAPLPVRRGTLTGGGAASFEELRDAIDAAWIVERESDDDGPRVAVISPALRGSFFFTREEAERRLKLSFPGSAPALVTRAARHLENRIRSQMNRRFSGARRNWVQGWKED